MNLRTNGFLQVYISESCIYGTEHSGVAKIGSNVCLGIKAHVELARSF